LHFTFGLWPSIAIDQADRCFPGARFRCKKIMMDGPVFGGIDRVVASN
jgi:hypothetical protein